MTPRFTFSAQAEADLDEIAARVDEAAGPRIALTVLRAITRAIRLIAQFPDLGHRREDLTSLPLKFWCVYSYFVVYDPHRRPVETVRVIHVAQDVESVVARLS